MELLRKIFKIVHRYWVQRSSEAYLNYLRKSGFKIGDNVIANHVVLRVFMIK